MVPDPHGSASLGKPDPHRSQMDPYLSQNSKAVDAPKNGDMEARPGAVETHNGGVEALIRAVKGLTAIGWRSASL